MAPELTKRKTKIVFWGHFGLGNGLGNLGNESTLKATLFNLRRLLPDADFSCICTGPTVTAIAHGIPTLPISRSLIKTWRPHSRVARMLRSIVIGLPCEFYRWLEGLKTLTGNDAVIVAGTGLVTDACGLRGWGPYNLFKWSLIAKIRGSKLLFVSVGAGPIYGRCGRFLVKSALALADFRSYRDMSSLEYLRGIGFAAKQDQVYPDLVFSLPQTSIPNNADKSTRRPVIGVGVMQYAGRYSSAQPSESIHRNYLESLLILVEWLLVREYDVRLLIGDMCDRPVIEEFKCLLKERLTGYDARRIIDEEVVSVDQLLSQLAETELVVATRFHNVLLALLNSKPVVAISFHHKVASLMSAMGLSEYCLDLSELKGEQLVDKVRAVQRNNIAVTALIRERARNYRAALEEQYTQICRELSTKAHHP